jgi:hypothetical protein
MRMIPNLLAAAALCVTPAEATRAALADVRALAPEYRQQMRYVVCENKDQQIAVTYLLNAISRSRTITAPKAVGGRQNKDGEIRFFPLPTVYCLPPTVYCLPPTLLRIDLAAYANQREPKTYWELHSAWERLAADDPYFHVKTQVAIENSGQLAVASGRFSLPATGHRSPATLTVDGGWVGLEMAGSLRAATGSAGAVLRADYFIARVAAEDYYAWAGVPEKQADFLSALGVDKGTIEKLAADSAANLFRSNITLKPRRVVRLPSPGGSIWLTLDVDAESPDRDPIRNPVDVAGPSGTQKYNFQASEVFFTRANGFWGLALYDAKGNRQASVPDRVAKDAESPDGIVQPLISCIRCHESHGAAGLQPFSDDQHALLSGQAAILKSYLPEVAQRVGELYDPAKLNREIQRDREDYAAAVKAACHCTTKEAASALADCFAAYAFEPVWRERAAAEAGVGADRFALLTAGSTDAITLALRAGKKVNRKAFEASYQDIMLRISK